MIDPNPSSLRSASIYQIFPRNHSEEGSLEAAAASLGVAAPLGPARLGLNGA